jgi:nitronate monooxygenase
MKMKELRIGDLTIKIPIVQGGMGVGISLASLASAVANEGGVGVISTIGIGIHKKDSFKNMFEMNIKGLKKEIQKAREMTKGVLGVNIMVALTNYADMVKTAIEEKIDIIFSGAGLPMDLPAFLNNKSKTKLVPIVSSARAAKIITKRWKEKYDYLPDAIVVEGPKAGGHLGFKRKELDNSECSLENIVPEVIEEVKKWEEGSDKKIPVIAAGGIYSGADIKKIIEMGASGVQMATRFVATDECDASIEFKNAYINAKKEDIIIIDSPVGLPGRAISNSFIKSVEAGVKHPINCPYKCIRTCKLEESPYCIAIALLNAQKGKLEKGFVFAGENAYKVKEIVSVKQLMQELVKEYNEE